MTLSLDTNAAIDLLKTRSGRDTRVRFTAALDGGRRGCLSSLVVRELMVGVFKRRQVTDQMQRADSLRSRLEVVDVSADDAISTARVRADLEASGSPIGASTP